MQTSNSQLKKKSRIGFMADSLALRATVTKQESATKPILEILYSQ